MPRKAEKINQLSMYQEQSKCINFHQNDEFNSVLYCES